jgi:hypothetical protein
MNQTKFDQPDAQLQKLDIEDQLSCPVCTNTYYNPVTLLCQHTFCYHCISDDKIKDCPICRIKKFIPANAVNNLTDNIIGQVTNIYYGTENMGKIKEEVEDYLEDKRLKPQIEKELETRLLASLNNLAIKNTINKPPKLNIYTSTIQYQPGVFVEPPESQLYKYLKIGAFYVLCLISGWIIGTVIGETINYFRGFGNITKIIYGIMRIVGMINLTYQSSGILVN